jgi:hypothetical protein
MDTEKLEKAIGTFAGIFGLGIAAGAAWVGWMDKRDRDAEKRRNLKRCKRLLNGWSSGPELVRQIDLIETRRDLEMAEYAYHEAKSAYDKLNPKPEPTKAEASAETEPVETADEATNDLT